MRFFAPSKIFPNPYNTLPITTGETKLPIYTGYDYIPFPADFVIFAAEFKNAPLVYLTKEREPVSNPNPPYKGLL